jgi:hypothetical protein
MLRRRKWLALAATAMLALAGGATAFAATFSYGAKPSKLTGYPTHINRLNLAGYVINTSYPLGKLDKGETYKQIYKSGGRVEAYPIAGPYAQHKPVQISRFKYIALPLTKSSFLVVWLEPNQGHNVFVFNLKTHTDSVVTYDQAGDPSLGAFRIVKRGPHPLR